MVEHVERLRAHFADAECAHGLHESSRADATTAVPLDAEMERLVAQRLAAYLHRDADKVIIRSRVDPAIIGGVVARVGDQLIDDSVRGRLERLRRTLAGTR